MDYYHFFQRTENLPYFRTFLCNQLYNSQGKLVLKKPTRKFSVFTPLKKKVDVKKYCQSTNRQRNKNWYNNSSISKGSQDVNITVLK